MKVSKTMKIGCLSIIGTFVLFVLIVIISDVMNANKSKNNSLEIEELIEQGDFVKAKKLAKSSEYGREEMLAKVVKAQVATLVDRGDLSLASDVAKEEGRYSVYFNVLLERLVPLYESNKQGLFMALAQLNIPSKGSSRESWDKEDYYKMNESMLNSLYTSYNSSLSQLMKYAKSKSDISTVKELAVYLKPQYKQVKGKIREWNVKLQEYVEVDGMVWEDTPSDYTQVDQIKKELGIK